MEFPTNLPELEGPGIGTQSWANVICVLVILDVWGIPMWWMSSCIHVPFHLYRSFSVKCQQHDLQIMYWGGSGCGNFLRYYPSLCGLVVRVPGCRSRGPGFDSQSCQIFWEVVGLEWGPLSLMNTTEEVLGRNINGFSPESQEYCRGDPLHWLFAIVRSQTKATEFSPPPPPQAFSWRTFQWGKPFFMLKSEPRNCWVSRQECSTAAVFCLLCVDGNTWADRADHVFHTWRCEAESWAPAVARCLCMVKLL
jgi:hypothetical protein